MLGESGHVRLLDALGHRQPGQSVDLPGVEVLPRTTNVLRRLAIGHWLRRWWPASDREGIAALTRPVLDAELALLTVAAEDFFTDDTLDSDAAALLAPHMADLNALAGQGDPRLAALVEDCRELAGDIGAGLARNRRSCTAARRLRPGRRCADGLNGTGSIAGGTATVPWSAVPPGVFDAAENSLEWSVTAGSDGARAAVRVALVGPDSPSGIEVELRRSGVHGSGALDAAGRAVVALHGPDGQPLTETEAWNLDWTGTAVRVGAAGAT
ncbi:hypothetical protein ATO49_16560, partial [Mycolicibacterium fortuitum subsp. fortuitum DSM 46621 = ATCC 6841 = JCM 6387]